LSQRPLVYDREALERLCPSAYDEVWEAFLALEPAWAAGETVGYLAGRKA